MFFPLPVEGFSRRGQRLRIPAAVHYDTQEMYAPIDECTASGNGFGGKCPAQFWY